MRGRGGRGGVAAVGDLLRAGRWRSRMKGSIAVPEPPVTGSLTVSAVQASAGRAGVVLLNSLRRLWHAAMNRHSWAAACSPRSRTCLPPCTVSI